MFKICLIVLSCYPGAFDTSKKPIACAINASEIFGVEHYEYGGRYMLYTTNSRYPKFSTIVESPSKVKELVDKCYKE